MDVNVLDVTFHIWRIVILPPLVGCDTHLEVAGTALFCFLWSDTLAVWDVSLPLEGKEHTALDCNLHP